MTHFEWVHKRLNRRLSVIKGVNQKLHHGAVHGGFVWSLYS